MEWYKYDGKYQILCVQNWFQISQQLPDEKYDFQMMATFPGQYIKVLTT